MNSLGSFAFTELDFENEDTEDVEFPITLPDIRNLWEKDLKCSNCKMNFNIPGLANTEKLACLFCYRGTCYKCLAYSKPHPETSQSEKMCKGCFVEQKKLKFILKKIDESRLEKIQMSLNVEQAVKENKEYASARKNIQKEIARFKKEQTDSLSEQVEILDSLKKSNESCLENLQKTSEKNLVLDSRYHSNFLEYQGLLNTVKIRKNKLQAKEIQENELRYKIAAEKQLQIELLQKHCKKKSGSEKTQKLLELQIEISQLSSLLSEQNKSNEKLEFSLSKNMSKHETNFSVISILSSKTRSFLEQPEEDFSIYQQERLDQSLEKLKKYDQIIEKLESRLSLLKTRQSKNISQLNFRLGLLYKKNELIEKQKLEKDKESNQTERVGSSACRQCVVN